jgi:hypothetical protein
LLLQAFPSQEGWRDCSGNVETTRANTRRACAPIRYASSPGCHLPRRVRHSTQKYLPQARGKPIIVTLMSNMSVP